MMLFADTVMITPWSVLFGIGAFGVCLLFFVIALIALMLRKKSS
ncbi:MAG: hypothetical protein ACKVH8_22815 [Pirellulales bacterium]